MRVVFPYPHSDVPGEKPRVKRWTLEELQNQAREYGTIAQAEAVLEYLKWLGEQA